MATLSNIEFTLLSQMAEGGVIPSKPTVLTLGETAWDPSLSLERLTEVIESRVTDLPERERLHQEVERLSIQVQQTPSASHTFLELAHVFYQVVLPHQSLHAIDWQGSPQAWKMDLNYPLDIKEQFDVILNLGTAAQVFNVCQFFKTCHELTRPGGVMLHGMPASGGQHEKESTGFYQFQPTFYYDLAAANQYRVMGFYVAESCPFSIRTLMNREEALQIRDRSPNTYLYALMGKAAADSHFQIPTPSQSLRAMARKLSLTRRELEYQYS